MTEILDWRVDALRVHAKLAFPQEDGSFVSVRTSVVSLAMHFELNSIPSCELQVPVGRDVQSGIMAQLHAYVNEMRILVPIRVWLNAETLEAKGAPDSEWPDRPVLLFDGYVIAVGWDHSFGSSRLSLALTHWLSDMAFSSAFSRISAPSNPGEFYYGSNFRVSPAGARSAFMAGLIQEFVTPAAIQTDFWGNSLLPWLAALCETDRFFLPRVGIAGQLKEKNYEALRALTRFEGFDDAAASTPYQFSSPMTMNLGLVGASLAAAAIARAVVAIPFESVAATTLWDLLVNHLAGQYLFSVVPCVDRALVVPFIPGLRATYKTLLANEYDAIRLDAFLPRPLRAVGVMGGLASLTGAFGNRRGKPVIQGIGGFFENTDPLYSSGRILLKDLPEWMAGLAGPAPFARLAAGVNDVKSTAASPAGSGDVTGSAAHTANVTAARSIWNEYARTLYLLELLRHRRFNIRSRFRLDIAPGATLNVLVENEQFVAQQLVALGLSPFHELYAHVHKVSVFISSEESHAYTLLGCSHARSSVENELDATSTNNHPLWGNIFLGAPLTDLS